MLVLASETTLSTPTQFRASATDKQHLDPAYTLCESMTAAHSRSFHTATRFLSTEKRRAVRALYAFCRATDNLVDDPSKDAGAATTAWRNSALSAGPHRGEPVLAAWADTQQRYRIPQRYVEQFLDGVARDLDQKRYATFEDLAEYAYGVASTVGLMSMHIIGYTHPDAIVYAVKLGVALQMTNILRDVAEDWRAGRLYLPQDELTAYGLGESDVAAGRVDDRWRAFMRFQIRRNRQLYAEARPGYALLHGDGRFAVAVAGELYRAILGDIEAHDYDVFSRRAHVSAWGKLRQLPRIWCAQR